MVTTIEEPDGASDLMLHLEDAAMNITTEPIMPVASASAYVDHDLFLSSL